MRNESPGAPQNIVNRDAEQPASGTPLPRGTFGILASFHETVDPVTSVCTPNAVDVTTRSRYAGNVAPRKVIPLFSTRVFHPLEIDTRGFVDGVEVTFFPAFGRADAQIRETKN